MKSYHIMVTSYGHADIVANSEEEALAAVNSMSESDFYWDRDWSADDASIVDETECEDDEEAEPEKKTYYVTVEKSLRESFTLEASDLDEVMLRVESDIMNADDGFMYDYTICDKDGETLVDWER